MNDMDYCQTVLDVTQALDHFITLAESDDDRVTIDCTLAGIASIILERLSEPFLDNFLDQFKDLKTEVARNIGAWEEEMLKRNMESTPDPRDDFKSNLLNIKGGVKDGHNDKENKAD